MSKKVMYAVGDSFTFGDELLDSVRKTNCVLVNTGQNQFNLEVLNHIHQKSHTLHLVPVIASFAQESPDQ